MSPTVSVIVPVYNVAQYLPQCLDSIVRQTYRQLEILLVDDGSTDNSGDICDQWADSDPRIRVIHKPNGGLSDARNAALDVMTGQLVTMVDSDDYLQLDAIEQLCRLMSESDADVAIGGYREVVADKVHDITLPTPLATPQQYDGEQALRTMLYQHGLTHSAWGRLYRSRLFDGIRYPVGMLYEDLAIAYDLYRHCSKVVYSDSQFYNYLQRPTSILGSFSAKRADVLDILERLERRVAADEPQLLPAVQSRLLSAYFNIMLLCPDDEQYQQLVDRCWQGIGRLRWSRFCDSQMRLKNKMGIMASLVGKTNFMRLFGRNH